MESSGPSTSYITWIIKKGEFRKFHNAKIGEFIASQEVKKENMIFYLKCFPNGSKHKCAGWVGLSLTLKKTSVPPHSNLLVRYYLYESQTSSVARGIARYSTNDDFLYMTEMHKNESDKSPKTRKRKNSFIDTMDASFTSDKKGGFAKANGTNYLCRTDSLKNYDIVSLVCEFDIVRMYTLGQLVSGSALKLNKIIQYKWKLTKKNLEKFKLCNNPYTRLYSEEFNIYNLVLVPSATTFTSKGNISLRLRLHELPPIIKSITLIVVLSCKQFERQWTNITRLSYEQSWVSWPSNTLKKSTVEEKISEYNDCITFECYVEILNIDMHNLIINDTDSKYKDVWNKFVIDNSNAFMDEKSDDFATDRISSDDADDIDTKNDVYVISEEDETESINKELEDEYTSSKKEELIRIHILKALDLNDQRQKEYLMRKIHNLNENCRILRKRNHRNENVLRQLQSTIKSMQANMFSCLNLQLNSVTMGNSQQTDEGDEKNAHKVLVIRTKDSSGYLLIGANKQGGYYHSKKYVTFSHAEKENITVALSLWDTPAIDFSANVHDQVTSPYYQFAHGLFCVYNVESIESFNLICNKISYFYKNPQRTPFKDVSKVAMILVGHKTKHFTESMRRVPLEKANKFANAIDITFLEVSSTNYQDVSDLYTILGKYIYQIYGELPLKNKQTMCEMLDVNHNINISTKKAIKKPISDDEKVNDPVIKVANIFDSDSESESFSDLSDAGNQPIKPKPIEEQFKRAKNNKKRLGEEMPARHRSSNEADHRPSNERKHKDSIECNPVSLRFKQFIEERVQMSYLYELFSVQHYDDIRMIEYFDEDMLKNEIGIKNLIHRKLFLQQCNDFKYEIEQFRKWLVQKLQLRRYLPMFEANGLITMSSLEKEIHQQSDFELKLKIVNTSHQRILWQELQSYESAVNDSDFNIDFTQLDNNNNNNNNNNNSVNSPSSSAPHTPKKPVKIIKTKMTNAYANIQRNKQIFNQITRTNQYKQETNVKHSHALGAKPKRSKPKQYAHSTRDLESMITTLELDKLEDGDGKPADPQKTWAMQRMQRSSSINSVKSVGSISNKSISSTPRANSSKSIKTKRKVKKRRKSFSLGM